MSHVSIFFMGQQSTPSCVVWFKLHSSKNLKMRDNPTIHQQSVHIASLIIAETNEPAPHLKGNFYLYVLQSLAGCCGHYKLRWSFAKTIASKINLG
jgi:hypothetical protein